MKVDRCNYKEALRIINLHDLEFVLINHCLQDKTLLIELINLHEKKKVTICFEKVIYYEQTQFDPWGEWTGVQCISFEYDEEKRAEKRLKEIEKDSNNQPGFSNVDIDSYLSFRFLLSSGDTINILCRGFECNK